MPDCRRAVDRTAASDVVRDNSEHFRPDSGLTDSHPDRLAARTVLKEVVVMRFALLASVLSAGWMLPALAQTPDADVQRAGQSVLDAWNRTMLAKNIPGHVALFAEDVIQVTPFGIVAGKPALTKSLEEQGRTYTPNPSTLKQVVMLGQNVMLRSGTWSGTLVLVTGSVPVGGYWSDVDVRDGDSWQIRQESWSITPPPQPQQTQK
jgi:Domain of unknown function (DUF4440)